MLKWYCYNGCSQDGVIVFGHKNINQVTSVLAFEELNMFSSGLLLTLLSS